MGFLSLKFFLRICFVFLSLNRCVGYVITTIAGTGAAVCSGDGGVATSAKMNESICAAIDLSLNVYISQLFPTLASASSIRLLV